MVVVNGDNELQSIRDMEMALNSKLPIVILEGSDFCNKISAEWNSK